MSRNYLSLIAIFLFCFSALEAQDYPRFSLGSRAALSFSGIIDNARETWESASTEYSFTSMQTPGFSGGIQGKIQLSDKWTFGVGYGRIIWRKKYRIKQFGKAGADVDDRLLFRNNRIYRLWNVHAGIMMRPFPANRLYLAAGMNYIRFRRYSFSSFRPEMNLPEKGRDSDILRELESNSLPFSVAWLGKLEIGWNIPCSDHVCIAPFGNLQWGPSILRDETREHFLLGNIGLNIDWWF